MSFSEPIKRTPETQNLYDHIQWLDINTPLMETVHARRMQVVIRILQKMHTIKEDSVSLNTSDK